MNGDWPVSLEKLRKTIKAAAPKVPECLGYRLPALESHWWLCARRPAIAFHPMSGTTVEAQEDELEVYYTSLGAIRFQPDQLIPATLVRKRVKSRIAENGD